MAASNNSLQQPLTISIVGAGIGGLTAAVALRRNGHNVQIFEAAEIKTEVGAAVGVQTNSLRVLDHLGVSRENLKGVPWQKSMILSSDGGEVTTYPWLVPAMQANGLLCHRSDLYEELKRMATDGEGEGPPAKLRLGTKVVACHVEEGSVTLDSGEVVHADLILGADGVHSVIRPQIIGSVLNAQDSGLSCFRVVLEAANLKNIPELEWLHANVSGTRSIIPTEGQFRMFLIYPCRNGSLLNVVAFYPRSEEEAGKYSKALLTFAQIIVLSAGWTPTATPEEFLTKFRDFDPKFLHILDLPRHSPILKWKLRVLPHLPNWVLGRAALLGDAAHGTLPLLGQGAGMAVEDAGSLACLLPAGTRREDVPARLEAYQDLRRQRGEFVRDESVAQASKGFGYVRSREIQRYLLEYDAIKAAKEFYRERFGGDGVSQAK
ncbi:FAD/NAD(P)-binding domain-containing protein [Mycena sanguinolenta]|uniref:FAD/NAD(P)-binding domain-containing protein n=1 Tax=Mycena sanguinolenta TaxID=230812 RepID=A0A8H6XUG9_9AGAR|nr:FAD/NAD(P)-binding domain-containing protein [Mycena sanguinolenta]